jgi:hypothetical protein
MTTPKMPFDERIRQYAARHNLLSVDARYMVDLLREAVAAEREACARLAECRFNGDHGTAYIHAGVQIAAAIRAKPAP